MMMDAAIENRVNHNISKTIWPVSMKFSCTLAVQTLQVIKKIITFKIPRWWDGGRAPSWKFNVRINLQQFTNYDEIWNDDVH